MDQTTIETLLDVIEQRIIPKTTEAVKHGNKLFGAAILRKSDLSIVVASTNIETKNPLYHGEVTAINDFYALEPHPKPSECIFLATHEPCSLCLSAITWAGFDNFSYLFTYEDSKKLFKIPYDIEILEEVFQVGDSDIERPLYNKKNKFFNSTSLKEEVKRLESVDLANRIEKLTESYDEISALYQKNKGGLILP